MASGAIFVLNGFFKEVVLKVLIPAFKKEVTANSNHNDKRCSSLQP